MKGIQMVHFIYVISAKVVLIVDKNRYDLTYVVHLRFLLASHDIWVAFDK